MESDNSSKGITPINLAVIFIVLIVILVIASFIILFKSPTTKQTAINMINQPTTAGAVKLSRSEEGIEVASLDPTHSVSIVDKNGLLTQLEKWGLYGQVIKTATVQGSLPIRNIKIILSPINKDVGLLPIVDQNTKKIVSTVGIRIVGGTITVTVFASKDLPEKDYDDFELEALRILFYASHPQLLQKASTMETDFFKYYNEKNQKHIQYFKVSKV